MIRAIALKREVFIGRKEICPLRTSFFYASNHQIFVIPNRRERARAKKEQKILEPIEFYIIVNIHHIKSRQNGMSTITFELELSNNERAGAYIEVR